jgi:hypothetical protein
MTTLVRAAVALAAALLGFGGFVAVQAASGSDDQPAKREDSLSVLTTADDSPSPDDNPSPDDAPAVQQDAPAVQDDAPDASADPSTRTRTGRAAVDDRDDTRDDVTDVTGTQTRTGGDDTSGDDTSGHDGADDRSGSNSGQG